MNLKYICLPLAISTAIFCLSPIGFSQQAGPSSGPPKTQLGSSGAHQNPQAIFFRSLGLDKDSTKKVSQVFKTAAEDLKTFRTQNKGDRKAVRQFALQETTKTNSALQGVLTPDQFQKYQTFKDELQLKPLTADNKVLRSLDLGKDLTKQVFQLKAKTRTEMGVFIAKNVGNTDLIRNEFTKDWTEYQANLKTLLTASQWQTYSSQTANFNPA